MCSSPKSSLPPSPSIPLPTLLHLVNACAHVFGASLLLKEKQASKFLGFRTPGGKSSQCTCTRMEDSVHEQICLPNRRSKVCLSAHSRIHPTKQTQRHWRIYGKLVFLSCKGVTVSDRTWWSDNVKMWLSLELWVCCKVQFNTHTLAHTYARTYMHIYLHVIQRFQHSFTLQCQIDLFSTGMFYHQSFLFPSG